MLCICRKSTTAQTELWLWGGSTENWRSDFVLCHSGPGSLLSRVQSTACQVSCLHNFFFRNFNLNTLMHLQVIWEMKLGASHRGLWWERNWLMYFEIECYCQRKMQGAKCKVCPKALEQSRAAKWLKIHFFPQSCSCLPQYWVGNCWGLL